ncbi:MAG: hypothetical protein ACYTGB_02020 [Planctomycetota bacterium]
MKLMKLAGVVLCMAAASAAGAAAGELPANTWVAITPRLVIAPGAVPAGKKVDRHWQLHRFGGVTYRPETGEVLILDGALNDTGIYASSVFGMNALTGDYTLYKATNWKGRNEPDELNAADPTPAPRHTYGAWCHVPEKKSVYLWDGHNRTVQSGPNGKVLGERLKGKVPNRWVKPSGHKLLGMWVFSFETGKWRSLEKSKVYPPSGGSRHMRWLPALKRIYLFMPLTGFHKDNVWSFDVETEQWACEGVKTKYECMPACFLDAKRERIVFAMAKDRASLKSEKIHGLGAYYPRTKKFEVLPVKGKRPANIGPGNQAWCHNTRHDLYFGWSGTYNKNQSDENWAYDPEKGEWRQFLPLVNIPVKKQKHVKIEYDAKNDLLVVCRQEKGSQWYAMRLDPATAKWKE